MAAGGLILLTGGNGQVGFRVLREALEKGYSVRAILRSSAKVDAVRTNPSLSHLDVASKLSFVVVPDLATPGALDEAVKGAKYIIHVASPVPVLEDVNAKGEDPGWEESMVKTAVRVTLNVFESARKAGGVDRIVVTSSVAALVPVEAIAAPGSSETIWSADTRGSNYPGPFPNIFAAYLVSKVAQLQEAEAWVAKENPPFEVIHLQPSWVLGRNDMARTAEEALQGSNGVPLNMAIGKDTVGDTMVVVHLDDVARAHVMSLDPKVKGNQNFLLTNTEPHDWEDATKYIGKHFPEAVKHGILPNNGAHPTFQQKFDAQKTLDTFGPLHSYEEMVVSVVGHYLELLEKEKKD